MGKKADKCRINESFFADPLQGFSRVELQSRASWWDGFVRFPCLVPSC